MGVFEMNGEIDNDFTTTEVVHVKEGGTYVDGVFVSQVAGRQSLSACIQPMSNREIAYLENGGERISDARKLYITQAIDGLDLRSRFEFFGQVWKVFEFDARPENTYYKIIVARVDN